MGASLLLTCAVIDDGNNPDWQAAGRHINDMAVEQFRDNHALLDQFDPDLVVHDEDAGDDIEPVAGENAGCDRCGTKDRAVGSRYCQACIDGARLDAMLDAAQVRGDDKPAEYCPNCGGPDGHPSEHAVGCPYSQAANLSMPEGATGSEPRGSVDTYLEVSGMWAISYLTRDWGPARRAALLAGEWHAKQALLDAAEQATLDRPDDIVRTVQTVTIHAERADDDARASTTSDQSGAGASATGAKLPVARISPEQLGDLRDGHHVELQTDRGEHAKLTPGDLTELQIEALAAGRPVVTRLEVDGDLTIATISLTEGTR